MNFFEKFKNAGCGVFRRRPLLSNLISKKNLSNEVLGQIAIELESQVRDSGFDEKVGAAQFDEKLRSLTQLQGWHTPYDVNGFIYSRLTEFGSLEMVTVTFRNNARFRHVFIRIGELMLDGEAVHVQMAHLDEMIDGARKARPLRRVLSAFDPVKIVNIAQDAREDLIKADSASHTSSSAGSNLSPHRRGRLPQTDTSPKLIKG